MGLGFFFPYDYLFSGNVRIHYGRSFLPPETSDPSPNLIINPINPFFHQEIPKIKLGSSVNLQKEGRRDSYDPTNKHIIINQLHNSNPQIYPSSLTNDMPPKRQASSSSKSKAAAVPKGDENSPFLPEILVRIFSHFSYGNLCNLQRGMIIFLFLSLSSRTPLCSSSSANNSTLLFVLLLSLPPRPLSLSVFLTTQSPNTGKKSSSPPSSPTRPSSSHPKAPHSSRPQSPPPPSPPSLSILSSIN